MRFNPLCIGARSLTDSSTRSLLVHVAFQSPSHRGAVSQPNKNVRHVLNHQDFAPPPSLHAPLPFFSVFFSSPSRGAAFPPPPPPPALFLFLLVFFPPSRGGRVFPPPLPIKP